MKKSLLLSAFVLIVNASFAKTVDGYIIRNGSDTVFVKLRAPGGIFAGLGYDINKRIEVFDSTGQTIEYTPADIKGFGYSDKSGHHNYLSKPIQDSSGHPNYFLHVDVSGAKACLYSYYVTVGSGNNVSYEFYYTFEKADGSILFLKNFDKLETLKDKLKAFYGDTEALQQFIDQKFDARRHIGRDVAAIVQEVNK